MINYLIEFSLVDSLKQIATYEALVVVEFTGKCFLSLSRKIVHSHAVNVSPQKYIICRVSPYIMESLLPKAFINKKE